MSTAPLKIDRLLDRNFIGTWRTQHTQCLQVQELATVMLRSVLTLTTISADFSGLSFRIQLLLPCHLTFFKTAVSPHPLDTCYHPVHVLPISFTFLATELQYTTINTPNT
jgi:hypothetical protein